jgi:flavin-dependent dehydrogenase
VTRREACQVDVAIVGSGPAGATLAALLAGRGLRVAVIGAPAMSAVRRAETLSRGALGLLGHVGLGSILTAAAIESPRIRRICWRSDDAETVEAHGVLVDRNRFDRALLAAAVERGAIAFEGWAATHEPHAATWRIAVRSAEGHSVVVAPLLVDASGRRGFGKRSLVRGAATVAVVGRWRGSADAERVAAGPQGWGWLAPVGTDVSEVTLFVAPEALRGARGDVALCYARLTRSLELVGDASTWSEPQLVRAYDATPRVDQISFMTRFLRLGDAAMTIDPIASAGCQLAIQGAVSALGAILTLLDEPANELIVGEYWRQEIERRWRRHSVWAATLHLAARARFDTAFWRARSRETPPVEPLRVEPLPRPTCSVRLASDVEFRLLPCRIGDRIACRPSVDRPGLAEPLIFVEGIEIAPLLGEAVDVLLAGELMTGWARKVGEEIALRLLSWFWRRRFLVDADGGVAGAGSSSAARS